MPIVYLSLGSNVGDKEENLINTITRLRERCTILKISSFHETEPVGYKDQPYFINCAIKIETFLRPHELLKFVKSIEQQLGRVHRFVNGPREIDIDILLYGDIKINTKELIIPHPRMHKREFVLKPLKEIM